MKVVILAGGFGTRLAEETAGDLDDDQYGWGPALPDDDEALSGRVAALAEWCDAFVVGLAQAALGERPPLAGEAREFVEDLQSIARVDAAAAGEEDAAALEELIEYVRMGVILLKGECRRAGEVR